MSKMSKDELSAVRYDAVFWTQVALETDEEIKTTPIPHMHCGIADKEYLVLIKSLGYDYNMVRKWLYK